MRGPQVKLTLEQQRAQNAWECLPTSVTPEYVKVVKSVPALIMNSGLLQVLAFLHKKGGDHESVAASLRTWMGTRMSGRRVADPGFEEFMKLLMSMPAADFQTATAEAFAWLKWLRQFAAARSAQED